MLAALMLTASAPVTAVSLLWPACFLWLALILSWQNLALSTQKQAGFLLLTGAIGIAWCSYQGMMPDIYKAFATNTPLLAMLMGVSFLSMTTEHSEADKTATLPTGRSALKQTLAGVHLFGAVINMSIVFIMADRFATASPDGRSLKNTQHQVLSRAFCAAAFWSPFFAAVAVALTYAPGAQLTTLMQAGIPLAAAGLILTYIELRPKASAFTGYPMQPANLILPAFLAIAVMSSHYLLPTLSVLQIISTLSPTTALLLIAVKKRSVLNRVHQHTLNRLGRMGNELALFLAAGVMAAGVGMVFTLYADSLPVPELTPLNSALLLLGMLLLSLAGIHPVISIATISGLLLPTHPPADLLAMIFLASWAIGTACSPMSGMNISLRGRYFISARQAIRNNLHYGFIMWLITSLSLWWYS